MFVNALSGLGSMAQETSSPPTFLGHGGMVTGSAGVPYPSGIQAGDFLTLMCFAPASLGVVTSLSGWTNYGIVVTEDGAPIQPNRYAEFYRIADGTEGSSLTVSSNSSRRYLMCAYRGVGSHFAVSGVRQASLNPTHLFPSVDTTENNALIAYKACATNDTAVDPYVGSPFLVNDDLSDISNIFSARTTSGDGGGFGVAQGFKLSSGSVRTCNFTNSPTSIPSTFPWLIVMYP